MKDHRRIDERSLEFGRAIAARLRAQPELMAEARENLLRWLATTSPRATPDLREWLDALDCTVEHVIELLTSPDERAVRLRQSNPFAGLLSAEERIEILKRFEAHDAAAT